MSEILHPRTLWRLGHWIDTFLDSKEIKEYGINAGRWALIFLNGGVDMKKGWMAFSCYYKNIEI